MASDSGADADGIPPRSLLELPWVWFRAGCAGLTATLRETEEGRSGWDGVRMVATERKTRGKEEKVTSQKREVERGGDGKHLGCPLGLQLVRLVAARSGGRRGARREWMETDWRWIWFVRGAVPVSSQ